MTQPQGVWMWVPIIRDPDVSAQLNNIGAKLTEVTTNQEILMTRFDDVVASTVAYIQALKDHDASVATQLEAALATIQNLIDTDASEDAAQLEAALNSAADQLSGAVELVKNPPPPPPVGEDPPADPPVEDPPADPPAEEPAP